MAILTPAQAAHIELRRERNTDGTWSWAWRLVDIPAAESHLRNRFTFASSSKALAMEGAREGLLEYLPELADAAQITWRRGRDGRADHFGQRQRPPSQNLDAPLDVAAARVGMRR